MPIRAPLPSRAGGAKVFRMEIAGLRDAQGRFADFRAKGIMARSREMVREMGRVYVRWLSKEAPVGKHFTWRGEPIDPDKRLKDSFSFKTFEKGKGINLEVYSSAKHIRWVIQGSYPYKRGRRAIYPRHKKALAFWWARKGKSVVCSRVMHPGSLPNLFHERAYELARPEIEQIRRKTARWMLDDLSWPAPRGKEVI